MVLLGIVSYKVFPARLGGQKGIADFYRFLAAENKIILASSSDNELSEALPFQILNFLFNQWKGFFNIIYIPKLIALIRKYSVDAVLIEHSYFGWMGIMVRWLTGKPYIIHSHNIESHRFNVAGRKWWRFYVRYEIFVHQQADFTFFKCQEDQDWAIEQWNIQPQKCCVITYGTNIAEAPSLEEKFVCRNRIAAIHSIDTSETIFLFNGSMNYTPNIDSIQIIINQIIPILQKTELKYRIILCGDFLSDKLANQIKSIPQIIFTGYVPDINLYFKGADAFINPSILATGIKTKLVEALANNLTVISTISGARGIEESIVKDKLILVKNEDWNGFANEMIQIKKRNQIDTQKAFYDSFYWGNIAAKVDHCLTDLMRR